MKVYIVRLIYDWEGFDIEEVFSTREAAEKAVKVLYALPIYADGIDIVEWEVQE